MCMKNKPVFDESKVIKDNAMLKIRPDLWVEWEFEKNDEIGLNIYEVTKSSDKIAWWICPKCKSDYDTRIKYRTQNKNCPYCAGRRVNHTNSLASLNPKLASEWHPTKNGDKTPNDFTCNSSELVWWQCPVHEDHEWQATISNRNSVAGRNKGSSCPYCNPNNPKVLIGYNDLWTTKPELAKLLLNPDDGYKYTLGSDKRMNWECPTCHEIIKNKSVDIVNKQGLTCRNCSFSFYYPEKFGYYLLKQFNIELVHDKSQSWSENKRYDFYIPSLNMIIEMHGKQHYVETTLSFSLQEVQENDRYKKELAFKNGIKHYIEIDCRVSDFEFIKSNILRSKLNDVFNLNDINWQHVKENTEKRTIEEIICLWNKGFTVKEIVNETDLNYHLVRSNLIKGAKNGLCDYSKHNALSRATSKRNEKRKVVKLSLDNKCIYIYDSIKDASIDVGVSISVIWNVCNNNRKTSRNFKWMYYEDYITQSNK